MIKNLTPDDAKKYHNFYYPTRRAVRLMAMQALQDDIRIAIGCMNRDDI
jgi:hypothetical protein